MMALIATMHCTFSIAKNNENRINKKKLSLDQRKVTRNYFHQKLQPRVFCARLAFYETNEIRTATGEERDALGANFCNTKKL